MGDLIIIHHVCDNLMKRIVFFDYVEILLFFKTGVLPFYFAGSLSSFMD